MSDTNLEGYGEHRQCEREYDDLEKRFFKSNARIAELERELAEAKEFKPLYVQADAVIASKNRKIEALKDELIAVRTQLEARHAAPPADVATNAAKWLALRNCARITAIGSAGCHPESPEFGKPYAHVTLNFWTHGTKEPEKFSREWLDVFVEKALRLSPTKAAVTSADVDETRLDFLASEYLHLVPFEMPTGGGDADVGWRVLQSHIGKGDVEIVAVYADDPRRAIDNAMLALTKSESRCYCDDHQGTNLRCPTHGTQSEETSAVKP